jgi:hypothetical protein
LLHGVSGLVLRIAAEMSYTLVPDLNDVHHHHQDIWGKGGLTPRIFASVLDAGVWPCKFPSL